MLDISKLSLRHHNLSYDYENNNIHAKPKIQQKSARKKCCSHLNHKIFCENFMCDPLQLFLSQCDLSITISKVNKIMRKKISKKFSRIFDDSWHRIVKNISKKIKPLIIIILVVGELSGFF